jgi:hypothetical protein
MQHLFSEIYSSIKLSSCNSISVTPGEKPKGSRTVPTTRAAHEPCDLSPGVTSGWNYKCSKMCYRNYLKTELHVLSKSREILSHFTLDLGTLSHRVTMLSILKVTFRLMGVSSSRYLGHSFPLHLGPSWLPVGIPCWCCCCCRCFQRCQDRLCRFLYQAPVRPKQDQSKILLVTGSARDC